ncbi:MAG: glycosyltransferase family 2 protein [Proteobacteria bacterium]|nr:MAG: glycosyltransferase family 2 protein [Pseudomonadota bacterium]
MAVRGAASRSGLSPIRAAAGSRCGVGGRRTRAPGGARLESPPHSGAPHSPRFVFRDMQPDSRQHALITLERLARSQPAAIPGGFAGALRALDPVRCEPAQSRGVVGRPAATDAWNWHRDALLALVGAPSDEGSRARTAYHSAWLLDMLNARRRADAIRLSIIIPVFNRARLVVEAIASALAQTHRDIEVIVVDDGSTDGLARAVTPYANRIRVIRQENHGVAHARNRGIRAASGHYLCFLDSDNLLDPDAAARWLDGFRAVPDADLCYAPPRQEITGGGHGGNWKAADGGEDCPTVNLLRAVSIDYPCPMIGVCFARWIVLRAGGFDERLAQGEDTWLWFRLGLLGAKAVGLERPMNERRIVEGSLSGNLSFVHKSEGFIYALALLALVERPQYWDLVPNVLRQLDSYDRWRWLSTSAEARVDALRKKLLEGVEDSCRRHDVATPKKDALRLALSGALAQVRSRDPELYSGGAFLDRLDASVLRYPVGAYAGGTAE